METLEAKQEDKSSSINRDVDQAAFNIASPETLTQSINFVNERFENMGLGSALNFASAEAQDVVGVVNNFYMLLERIRLQKKQLEENRAQVRRLQTEIERMSQEKQQLSRQLQQSKEAQVRDQSKWQSDLREQKRIQGSLEQQLQEAKKRANEAVNRFNVQTVTMNQQSNELNGLRQRLNKAMRNQPIRRHVFNMNGSEPEEVVIDVKKEFENKLSEGYEQQLTALRKRVFELEQIVYQNEGMMSNMIEKQGEVLQNLNVTPVRRVFPAPQQSPIYGTPQIRCVSLFGSGEDVQTYAQSKLNQFEEQLQKIADVGEDYSSEKLRGLLREANGVIREQLTLLHTLVGNQPRGDALSFLEESSSAEDNGAMEEDSVQIDLCVCYYIIYLPLN